MDYSKKPFTVDTYNTFETLAEATKYARQMTMSRKEDTVIQQNIAVVKFPIPDYEVETLSV